MFNLNIVNYKLTSGQGKGVRPCRRKCCQRAKEVIIGVLPEALRGDGQDGELRTVVPRLALFGVSTNKSNL
jgi:hypothetical protein